MPKRLESRDYEQSIPAQSVYKSCAIETMEKKTTEQKEEKETDAFVESTINVSPSILHTIN